MAALLQRGLVLAATTLMAAVAACASVDLAIVLATNVRMSDATLGPLVTTAVMLGVVAALALGWWFLRRPWAYRLGDRAWLALGLGVLVGFRLVAIATINAPLIVDWLHYHEAAIQITQGGPWLTSRPPGLPLLLAPLYLLFGPHPILGEVVNVVAGGTAGAALFFVGRWVSGARAGGIALLLYAVAPSQILMSTVVGSEILYGAGLVAALAFVLHGTRLRHALAAGAVFAAAQYVRATSLVLLPVLLGIAWARSRRSHPAGAWSGRSGRNVAAALLAFCIVLVPVAIANVGRIGWPSPSTSSFQNWELLLGTDQLHDGRFNADDVARVGGDPGTPQAEAVAARLAWQQVTSDPLGTAGLFLRKFPQLWADEHYGARWALFENPAVDRGLVQVMVILSEAWLILVAGLGAIGLWRVRRRPPLGVVAVAAMLVVYGIAMIPFEANPRYHAPMIPLLCILATLPLATRTAADSASA